MGWDKVDDAGLTRDREKHAVPTAGGCVHGAAVQDAGQHSSTPPCDTWYMHTTGTHERK